jgi:hypothetical protein
MNEEKIKYTRKAFNIGFRSSRIIEGNFRKFHLGAFAR